MTIKHWFIDWLEETGELKSTSAQRNRKKIHEVSDREFQVARERLVQQQERASQQLVQFSLVAQDMIRCGLEQQAIAYYDAKQQIENLPKRPQKETCRLPLLKIIPIVYERMQNASNDEALAEDLNEIWTTLRQLTFSGMEEEGLAYYMRIKSLYPNLKLPDPDPETE